MEDDDPDRRPKCLWGDGCLLRLSDQTHAETYAHTTSIIRRCATEDCPLYQKAYDYIVGPQGPLTPEIKKAQQHVALHYHPPIRSRSVARTRPRSTSIAKYRHRSLDRDSIFGSVHKNTVPKLNLDEIPHSPIPKETSESAPNMRYGNTDSPTHPRTTSEPSRKMLPAIKISPKRRSTNDIKLDSISIDLEELKTKVSQNQESVGEILKNIHQDVVMIKNLISKFETI